MNEDYRLVEVQKIADDDERTRALEALVAATRDAVWSQATVQLAVDDFGQARFDKALERAMAVASIDDGRFDEVASIRANTLLSNLDEQFQRPHNEERLISTIRRALVARLADLCGVNWAILARCYNVQGHRSDERRCADAAARCFLETDLAAAGPSCLHHLAIMDRDDGNRERALRYVYIALEHTKRFPPFGSRSLRPHLEALRDELEREA